MRVLGDAHVGPEVPLRDVFDGKRVAVCDVDQVEGVVVYIALSLR